MWATIQGPGAKRYPPNGPTRPQSERARGVHSGRSRGGSSDIQVTHQREPVYLPPGPTDSHTGSGTPETCHILSNHEGHANPRGNVPQTDERCPWGFGCCLCTLTGLECSYQTGETQTGLLGKPFSPHAPRPTPLCPLPSVSVRLGVRRLSVESLRAGQNRGPRITQCQTEEMAGPERKPVERNTQHPKGWKGQEPIPPISPSCPAPCAWTTHNRVNINIPDSSQREKEPNSSEGRSDPSASWSPLCGDRGVRGANTQCST